MFDSRLLYRRKPHIFHSKRAKRVAVCTSIVDLRTFSMINTWSGLFDNATKCVKKYILSWSFHTRWIELPSETWEANDCGTLHTVGFSTNGYKRNNTLIRWFFSAYFLIFLAIFGALPKFCSSPHIAKHWFITVLKQIETVNQQKHFLVWIVNMNEKKKKGIAKTLLFSYCLPKQIHVGIQQRRIWTTSTKWLVFLIYTEFVQQHSKKAEI